MTVTLIVPGRAVGKGRPRSTKSGRMYTPAGTVKAEGDVRAAWYAAGQPRIDGRPPLQVLIISAHRRPENHWRVNGSLSAAGERSQMPVRRPDIDNQIKLVLDSLNGAAYEDDVQVVSIKAVKRWAAPMEAEHVRVEVSEFRMAA